MRRAALLAGLSALVLAGSADAAPRRLINGVNVLEPFTAVGTEPFWDVTIKGRAVTWSDPETENRRGSVGKPTFSRGRVMWRGTVEGHGSFSLTLTSGPCSDGMSDFTYPLTARVVTGDLVLEGCAATVAAFARRDREGRDDGEIR